MNIIFDIGFNLGEFSAIALQKYPSATIIGVDANPAFNNVETASNITFLNRLVSHTDNQMRPLLTPASLVFQLPLRSFYPRQDLKREVNISKRRVVLGHIKLLSLLLH